MVEDFHEKMNFLQLIMDKYFKSESCRDAATLYQLKNLLNRRNVSKNVSSNYHAASDFVDLVTECHVIAACLEYCGMESIEIQCKKIPVALHIADSNMKRRLLRQLVGEVVDTYFLNAITINVDRIEDPASTMDEAPIAQDDAVHNYATNFTKMGLLRKVSVHATRYGDGNRMLRHWKYAMLLYHQGHKVKYRLESYLLLAGVNALLTPRQRQQVISNRFVNLHGGEGHNLEGDYVMELLNRYAKSRIKLLGPNHTESCVERIGKTMMFCHDIQDKLEKQINVAPLSREHTPQSLQRDRNTIIQQLINSRVFQVIPGRSHETFTMENVDILSNVNVHELHKWITEKKREYSFGKYAF
ncbi:uncharacterized protein LOC134272329 [Saccostrea cucullata]|uniref:uncharacterized protein LOC134272329 n=1 Tax=Saccostrea cuccullata TaxID=36930 RepID=UPI002ED1086E